jgi:hypothetical protein
MKCFAYTGGIGKSSSEAMVGCGHDRERQNVVRRWIFDKRPVLGPVVRLAQSVLPNISIRFGFKKVRGLPHAECR